MGSLFSKTFDPEKDVSDLTGKVIIVTGGNAGIGFAIVQHLACHGAKVYLAARNEERAKAAIERLKKEGLGPGNGEVVWLKLDLADPKLAKAAAEEFLSKEKRLDVLINNAALLLVPYAKSNYDLQDVMVTNHLSPFVFTTALLPLLKETSKLEGADVRIVNVSSDAIKLVKTGLRYRSKEDFNDEHAKAFAPPMSRYARSKLANVLFTRELQHRLDAEELSIIVIALHPGNVDTDGSQALIRGLSPFWKIMMKVISALTFSAPSEGATSSIFAAAAPAVRAEPDKYKAAYLSPKATIDGATPDAKNDGLAKELWETTERLLKEIDV